MKRNSKRYPSRKKRRRRYRINFRRVTLLAISLLVIIFLIFKFFHKPDKATLQTLSNSTLNSLLSELNRLKPQPFYVLRNKVGRPEIYALNGSRQHPVEILTDGHFGHSPANIYRIGVNWVNNKPVFSLPPNNLSTSHLSFDKDLTIQPPLYFYLNVFNNQVQSLTVCNVDSNMRQIFDFTGDIKSAELTKISRHRIDVRFLPSGYVWDDAMLSISNKKVVSNSPSLVSLPTPSHNALFIRLVEAVKSYVSSGLVAFIENTWYGFQDTITRLQYYLTHRNSNKDNTNTNAGTSARANTNTNTNTGTLPSSAKVPWQVVGPTVGGKPVLEKAILHPDAERPYANAYLVKIDPRYVNFHLVAGTKDPASITGIHGTGMIPTSRSVRKRVLAAFNSGFYSRDGHYGVMVDSKLYLPPKTGLATVALYSDGRVALDSWGKILPSPKMVSFRQNLPLLLNRGRLNPNIKNQKYWGVTVGNAIRVWRSGLGITGSGKIIYAAGYPLSARTLALALQASGCIRAMELDVNSYWTTFNFYQWVTRNGSGRLMGTKLAPTMQRSANRYLTPDTRDFFYLTLKQGF